VVSLHGMQKPLASLTIFELIVVAGLIYLTTSLLEFTLFSFELFWTYCFLLLYNAPVQMPYMIFTGLEDYKARGTQASPYYTVTHYTEFAETKDTVLIRGDVVFTSKLTDSEAKTLLETAHSFYLNDTRYRLVERFNKETHDFEFGDVLQVLDMPTM